MDEYFKWSDLCEDSKVRFAQMHLRGSAERYWFDVRGRMKYERQETKVTWKDMRSKLRARYLGESYEQRLLCWWYQLRQGNRPVSEYIEDFQWYVMKCNTIENEV